MLSLIQNENMKIFRRARTWVMVILILLAVLVHAFVAYTLSKNTLNPDWKSAMAQQTQSIEAQMRDTPTMTAEERALLRNQVLDNQYHIEHNLAPWSKTAFSFTENAVEEGILVIIFTIVIAGDIVASEYSTGTIKLLLIRPVKRWKILLAKFLATLGFGIGSFLLVMLWSFLLGGIFFGFQGADQPNFLTVIGGDNLQISMGTYIWVSYGLKAVMLVVMVAFAFMLSTIFQSSALAISLTILSMLFGPVVCSMMNQFAWVRYVLFANLDLSQFFSSTTVVPGLTPWFSVANLIVYFILFYLLAWLSFNKRDVKV